MTLRHLKIYLAVYQTENVTKAAEQLHMTQPAVSRAIQEIEQYYGIRLFERINRRLCVTESGRAFYARALHIVDSFDQLDKEMRNWDEVGVLRIGTSVTIGNALLPKALRLLRQQHPHLQIQSTVSNGASLQQAILNNRLDFALIEGSIDDEALCREVVAADRLVLVLPPDDPRAGAAALTLQDLADGPFLLRENGSAGRMLLNHIFAVHGLPLAPAMESISTQALLQAVHEGLGISFLPEQLARPAIESGFVATRAVDDESFRRENHLVWHRHKYLTRSAREAMELFRTLMRQQTL
jgi:DNA-binding transcriptional LysR family regulator